jgi:hypothetical protein
MDNVETYGKYLDGLSEAEYEQGVAIESEIAKILREGFTEKVGLKFVCIVLEIRKKMPTATVGGIFDAALDLGLSSVVAAVVKTTSVAGRKRISGGKGGSTLK